MKDEDKRPSTKETLETQPPVPPAPPAPRYRYRVKDEFGEAVVLESTGMKLSATEMLFLDGETVIAHYRKWSCYHRIDE